MARKDLSPCDSKLTIDKSSVLGSGSYGGVYIAQWHHLTCAAKIIHTTLFTTGIPGRPNMAEQFKTECESISKFRHPNIVQFLGMEKDPDTHFPVLLMELMDKSLTKLLEGTTVLSYPMQISICHDISLAMTYMHSKFLIHRDISSNNVLMKGSVAKLADLGVSVLMDSTKSNQLTTKCPGTEVYMPPESVSDTPVYTEKIDCFSFGVVALQIITCEFPKAGPRTVEAQVASDKSSMKMFCHVPEVERRSEQLSDVRMHHPLRELIINCLNDEDTKRPTAEKICCYVAHLKQVEEAEERLRAKASGASPSAESQAEEEESRVRQLRASLEDYQITVAQLQTQCENKNAEISRLQQLLSADAVSYEASPSSLIVDDACFGGDGYGSRRTQESLRAEIQNLNSQLEQLKQDQKTDKQKRLEKWDWLETKYHRTCQEAKTAQERVEHLESEQIEQQESYEYLQSQYKLECQAGKDAQEHIKKLESQHQQAEQAAKERYDHLESQYQIKCQTANAAKERVERVQSQGQRAVQTAQERLEKLQSEHRERIEEVESQREQLESQYQEAKNALEQAAQTAAEFEGQYKDSQKYVQELEAQHEVAQQEMESEYQVERQELQAQLEELEQATQERIEKLELQCQQEAQKLQELVSQYQLERHETAQKHIDELQQLAKDKESQYQAEREETQERVAELESQHQQAVRQFEELDSKCQQAAQKVLDQESEYELERQEMQQCVEQLMSECQDQESQYRTKCQAKQARIEELELQCQQAEEQESQYRTECQETQERVEERYQLLELEYRKLESQAAHDHQAAVTVQERLKSQYQQVANTAQEHVKEMEEEFKDSMKSIVQRLDELECKYAAINAKVNFECGKEDMEQTQTSPRKTPMCAVVEPYPEVSGLQPGSDYHRLVHGHTTNTPASFEQALPHFERQSSRATLSQSASDQAGQLASALEYQQGSSAVLIESATSTQAQQSGYIHAPELGLRLEPTASHSTDLSVQVQQTLGGQVQVTPELGLQQEPASHTMLPTDMPVQAQQALEGHVQVPHQLGLQQEPAASHTLLHTDLPAQAPQKLGGHVQASPQLDLQHEPAAFNATLPADVLAQATDPSAQAQRFRSTSAVHQKLNPHQKEPTATHTGLDSSPQTLPMSGVQPSTVHTGLDSSPRTLPMSGVQPRTVHTGLDSSPQTLPMPGVQPRTVHTGLEPQTLPMSGVQPRTVHTGLEPQTLPMSGVQPRTVHTWLEPQTLPMSGVQPSTVHTGLDSSPRTLPMSGVKPRTVHTGLEPQALPMSGVQPSTVHTGLDSSPRTLPMSGVKPRTVHTGLEPQALPMSGVQPSTVHTGLDSSPRTLPMSGVQPRTVHTGLDSSPQTLPMPGVQPSTVHTGLEPQTLPMSGVQPSTVHTGLEPQTLPMSGVQPRTVHTGLEPQTLPMSGVQPRTVHTGLEPQTLPMSGVQPRTVHTGLEPQTLPMSGVQPSTVHTGLDSSPRTLGVQPRTVHTGLDSSPQTLPMPGVQPRTVHTGLDSSPQTLPMLGVQPRTVHTGLDSSPQTLPMLGVQPRTVHTGLEPQTLPMSGVQPRTVHTELAPQTLPMSGVQPRTVHTGLEPQALPMSGVQPRTVHTGLEPQTLPMSGVQPRTVHTGLEPQTLPMSGVQPRTVHTGLVHSDSSTGTQTQRYQPMTEVQVPLRQTTTHTGLVQSDPYAQTRPMSCVQGTPQPTATHTGVVSPSQAQTYQQKPGGDHVVQMTPQHRTPVASHTVLTQSTQPQQRGHVQPSPQQVPPVGHVVLTPGQSQGHQQNYEVGHVTPQYQEPTASHYGYAVDQPSQKLTPAKASKATVNQSGLDQWNVVESRTSHEEGSSAHHDDLLSESPLGDAIAGELVLDQSGIGEPQGLTIKKTSHRIVLFLKPQPEHQPENHRQDSYDNQGTMSQAHHPRPVSSFQAASLHQEKTASRTQPQHVQTPSSNQAQTPPYHSMQHSQSEPVKMNLMVHHTADHNNPHHQIDARQIRRRVASAGHYPSPLHRGTSQPNMLANIREQQGTQQDSRIFEQDQNNQTRDYQSSVTENVVTAHQPTQSKRSHMPPPPVQSSAACSNYMQQTTAAADKQSIHQGETVLLPRQQAKHERRTLPQLPLPLSSPACKRKRNKTEDLNEKAPSLAFSMESANTQHRFKECSSSVRKSGLDMEEYYRGHDKHASAPSIRESPRAPTPSQYSDPDSIKRVMKSEGSDHVFLAALIQQQSVSCQTESWTVVFTVCRQNSCCIEPLLDLLRDNYGEKFLANIISVKFSESNEEGGPHIELVIPTEEIEEQGYTITSAVTPCLIKKKEAFGPPGQHSKYTYPRRFRMTVKPPTDIIPTPPLKVCLELKGTDDQRKFTLTNPPIALVTSTSQESESSPILDIVPEFESDPLIGRIMQGISSESLWEFGGALGVSPRVVQSLGTSQPVPSNVLKIFQSLSKSQADPAKKNWKHILGALKKVEENVLAKEILEELRSS